MRGKYKHFYKKKLVNKFFTHPDCYALFNLHAKIVSRNDFH